MMYKFNEKVSVKALADLRESVGWNRMEKEYKNPLMTSYYHIAVYENDKLIGYIDSVSNEVSDALPRSQLLPGDVVMTYVGANIGDVALIDDKYKYHLAPNVAKIRVDDKVYNSVYFMYMLMFLNSYIVKNSADTAKAALGMERIRKLKVFIPTYDLQNQFATFVHQVNKSKFEVQKSLEKTQLLYDSLMQEYFG